MTSESLDPSSSCLAQEVERVLGARTYYDVLQVDPSDCLPRSLLHQAPQFVATTTTTVVVAEEDERRTAVRDVQEEEAEAEEEAKRVRRVVATSYRQLALRLHPDRHSALPSQLSANSDHQEAADTDGVGGGGGVQQWKSQVVAAFAKVQEAYETLQDPIRRAAYDASLRCGGGSSSAALHSPLDEVTLQKAWIVLQQLFFSSPPTVPAASPSYSAPAEGVVGPPPEALRTFVLQSSASPTAAVPTAAPKTMMQQQQTCRTSGCQEVVSILGATCHRCRNQPLASVSARCSEPGCLRLLTEADRLLQQDHPSSNRAITRAMCSHCRKKPVKCAKFGCLVKVPPDEEGGGRGYCSKHRNGAV